VRLHFIGGASGSGKTAVMPYLKELLGDNIAVYDFDDIGVPDAARFLHQKGILHLKNLSST